MMERKRHYPLPREDSNTSNFTSDFFAQSEERKPVRKLVTPSSSLEIVEGDPFAGASGTDRSPSEAPFRSWSRASVGSVPPRSDSSLSRRTLTPTKQISLQAVRRREESSEPFLDHIDVESARLESNNRKVCWDFSNHDDDVDFSRLSVGDHRRSHGNNNLVNGDNVHASSISNGETSQGKSVVSAGGNNKRIAPNHKTKDNKDSSSDDDDDDENDDDGDKKKKAPNELLMEFVDCLMKKDYPNASKLCKMILLFEPENEEALKFQPLIEEKMRLDAEAAAAEEEEGSSDEDDDDDDDDSDEDSSSDDDEDDDDESEDDDDSGDKKVPEGSIDNKIIGANTSRVWKPAS